MSRPRATVPSCLVLDVAALPWLSGLDLQGQLARRAGTPITFITAECHASLTPREREVMALVVTGLLNKQVAGELGISEITVKAHRGQVMRKMKADSLPDLVTMAAKLGLRTAPGGVNITENGIVTLNRLIASRALTALDANGRARRAAHPRAFFRNLGNALRRASREAGPRQ